MDKLKKLSQETLSLFLKAITPTGNKSNIQTYSTPQFYATEFVKNIVSGKTIGPDQADIITTGEKIGNYYVFQVKESYNIDKTNTAGVNGIYFYGLVKSGDKWLVNFRGEEKPS